MKKNKSQTTVGANCVRPKIEKRRKPKGITLIALVITIIVMLILVSVTVTYGIKSGLLGKAKESKEKYANSEEKETIALSANEWSIEKNVGTEKTFFEFMEEKLAEKANVTMYDEEENSIIVEFKESGICYKVKEDGSIECLGTIEDAKTITVNCYWGTDKKTRELIKTFEVKTFSETSKIKLSKIEKDEEEYEPKEEILLGEVTGKTATVEAEYYKIIKDEKGLVFTDIDENTCKIGTGSGNGNGIVQDYQFKGEVVVYIPEEYNGKRVTEISANAFYGYKKIVKVTIGDNVTSIGAYAFFRAGIKEVVIGKGVTTLGNRCFEDCPIEKLIYNNESSAIKDFVQRIPFTAWTKIEVNNDNKVFKVVDNILYTKDGETLVKVPTGIEGKFIIDETVKTLEQYSFAYCSKITKVTIGDNVTSIGAYAFFRAGIEEVVMGNSITTLGICCFDQCTKITEITIRNSVTSIGKSAFNDCTNLKTVIIDSATIAKGLTSQTVYWNLINEATTIYIKDDITEIGSYVTTNFTKQATSDKTGYNMYVKNS